MKKNIDTNLGTLLNPTPTAPTKAQAPEQAPEQEHGVKRAKGNTKPVCYSIPPETAEKIRQIASWDRKTINAVATEAFEQYARNWKPTTYGEPPKF